MLSASGLERARNSFVPGRCAVDAAVGGTLQALGHRSAESWLSGKVPWWNHDAAVGLPLAAEMQPASLFLPFVLLLHFRSGTLWLKIAMQILCGAFTLVALRTAGFSRFSATLAGAMFELNSTYAWFGDAPMLPVAFLPLLVLGIERCRLRGAAPFSGARLVALAIAFSLYAGFPETAFLDGVLAGLWILLRHDPARDGATGRLAARLCLGLLCGLGLAVPVLVPFLQSLPASTVTAHALQLKFTAPPAAAASLLFPAIWGAPHGDARQPLLEWAFPVGYLGPSLAFLAFAALCRRRLDRLRVALAGWIVFCLASAFDVPVIGVLHRFVPLVDEIDFKRYAAVSITFACTVLAASQLDDWRNGKGRAGLVPAGMMMAAGAVIVLHLARHRIVSDWRDDALARFFVVASAAEAVLAIILLIGLMSRVPTRGAQLGAGLLLSAEAVLSFLPPVLAGVTRDTLDLAPIAWLQRHAGTSRVFATGGTLIPNYGSWFDVATINDAVQPAPAEWFRYAERLTSFPLETGEALTGIPGDAAARRADFLAHRAAFAEIGTGFVLARVTADPFVDRPPPGFAVAFEDRTDRIWRLDGARPYVSATPACTLRVATRDDIEAICPHAARLTRLELMHEGWRAEIDGRATPIAMAPPLFQRIDLPSGRTRIVFSYAPAHVGAIGIVFVASVLAWLVSYARWAAGARSARLIVAAARGRRNERRRFGTTDPR